MPARKGKLERKTKETDIIMELCLDGAGKADINTGVGFLDHMLELFAVHGSFDLKLICKGDTKVDGHHSVEDIGITLGKLFNQLLGDKKGIARFATEIIPMDEALCMTVVDISGRPFLKLDTEKGLTGKTGEFDMELVEEFLRALCTYGMITAHIKVLDGKNNHHIAEAVFKSLARSLSAAVKIVSDKIPSSKGSLEA